LDTIGFVSTFGVPEAHAHDKTAIPNSLRMATA